MLKSGPVLAVTSRGRLPGRGREGASERARDPCGGSALEEVHFYCTDALLILVESLGTGHFQWDEDKMLIIQF